MWDSVSSRGLESSFALNTAVSIVGEFDENYTLSSTRHDFIEVNGSNARSMALYYICALKSHAYCRHH